MRISIILSTFLVLGTISPALADGPAIPLPDVGAAISDLVGSVQNVFTSQVEPQLGKFWEGAQKLGPQVGHDLLDKITGVSSDVASAIDDLKKTAERVVKEAEKIHADIQKATEKKGITIEHVTDLLSHEIGRAVEDIQDRINDPLPEDRGEKAKARAEHLNAIMDKVQVAYIHVLTQIGVPRADAEAHLTEFIPALKHVLLIIGNITDEHPLILQSVVFAASMLFLPNIHILRPILDLLGFGPQGPVKNMFAAWAQRVFFGPAVPADSWFAFLQKTSMTLPESGLMQKLAISLGLAAAVGNTGDREEL